MEFRGGQGGRFRRSEIGVREGASRRTGRDSMARVGSRGLAAPGPGVVALRQMTRVFPTNPPSITDITLGVSPLSRSAFAIHCAGQDLGLSATFQTMSPPGLTALARRDPMSLIRR